MTELSHLQKKQVAVTAQGIQVFSTGEASKSFGGSSRYQVTNEGEISRICRPKSSAKRNTEKNTRTYSINKSKVRSRIITQIESQKGYKQLYMVTVTFPKGIKDEMGYQLLNTWFTRLRQQNLLKSYLWVAERQQNGTIHFHVAITHFVSITEYNEIMREAIRYQIKHGNLKWSYTTAFKYNGIDIAKDRVTKKITNYADYKMRKKLSCYLSKYMSKSDIKFKHLAWHNSRDFSAIFLSKFTTQAEILKTHKNILNYLSTAIHFEFVSIMYYRNNPPPLILEELITLNDIILEMEGYYQFKELIKPKFQNINLN